MKKCFGYVRVSTAKQGEGVSLIAQKEAITLYAEQNEIEITQWFEEKETAAKQGRPLFNLMIRTLKKGKVDGLVIHKIDRSARNFSDWAKIGQLNDLGFDIHFATETLDFRSRGGRLSADIQAVIAADYIRNLREEAMKGIVGRLKQGFYPFKAPLGYLDNGGGKVKTPDPERAQMIKDMFDLYASGRHSLRTLRVEMMQRGLTNTRGKHASKHLIETILSNPFYCGIVRIKTTGDTYEGIHEPLISTSTFDRVQDVKSGKAGKKVTRHNHLYRGLFKCGFCQTSMIPERQKGIVYYRCHTPGCPTKSVREDQIEQTVDKALRKLEADKASVESIVQKVKEWVDTKYDPMSDDTALQNRLTKVSEKIESLTDALIDRLIDKETYSDRREKLLMEKRKIDEQAQEITNMQQAPNNVRKFLEHVKTLAALYDSANPLEKRELVQTTTSNRIVLNKNIEFKPSNWLKPVWDSLAVPDGEPTRPTSRSYRDIDKTLVEDLIEAARSRNFLEFGSNIAKRS